MPQPMPKMKPIVPYIITAVTDPRELTTEGKPIQKLATCIPDGKPCKLLFLSSDGVTSNANLTAPFKFMQFTTADKCCEGMTCKERDVAALSYYRNDFQAGSEENVGSIAYCENN